MSMGFLLWPTQCYFSSLWASVWQEYSRCLAGLRWPRSEWPPLLLRILHYLFYSKWPSAAQAQGISNISPPLAGQVLSRQALGPREDIVTGASNIVMMEGGLASGTGGTWPGHGLSVGSESQKNHEEDVLMHRHLTWEQVLCLYPVSLYHNPREVFLPILILQIKKPSVGRWGNSPRVPSEGLEPGQLDPKAPASPLLSTLLFIEQCFIYFWTF